MIIHFSIPAGELWHIQALRNVLHYCVLSRRNNKQWKCKINSVSRCVVYYSNLRVSRFKSFSLPQKLLPVAMAWLIRRFKSFQKKTNSFHITVTKELFPRMDLLKNELYS